MVTVPEWLLVTVQWVHHLGAVSWVGGSIFYRFVLQPAFRKADTEPTSVRAIGHEFGRIVRVAIVILVVTGAFLAVVHLSAGGNSSAYIGILALKIALAFYMFLVVWLRRRSATAASGDGPVRLLPRLRSALTSTTALLIIGIAVIGLADVLGSLHGHAHGATADASADHHAGDEAHAGEDAHADDDHHAADDAHAGEDAALEAPPEAPDVPDASDAATDDSGGHDSDGHDHSH